MPRAFLWSIKVTESFCLLLAPSSEPSAWLERCLPPLLCGSCDRLRMGMEIAERQRAGGLDSAGALLIPLLPCASCGAYLGMGLPLGAQNTHWGPGQPFPAAPPPAQGGPHLVARSSPSPCPPSGAL